MSSKKNPTARGARTSSFPLCAKRIVITRARRQANSLAEKIEALGGEVIEFPTIEIVPPLSYHPLDAAIAEIATYDWLMLTSVNGVDRFLARARALGRPLTELNAINICAIGPETAKILAAAGVAVCLVPGRYQAEGIIESLSPKMMRGRRVLIPRAAGARELLPDTLRQWGADVTVVEAYRTVVPRADTAALRHLLRGHRVDMITFTSSSTVGNFGRLFAGEKIGELLNGVAIGCIGPVTQKTVEQMGARADVVAQEFTIPGLVRAVAAYFAPDCVS